MRFGFPTPFITLATNEWTGAMSATTFGTSAKATLPPNIIAEVSEKILLDILISMLYCLNVIT